MNKLIISAIALVMLWACNSSKTETLKALLEEAKKAIAKSNDIYFQSFAKHDSSIFIDRYAKDCCIMPPGEPARCGENAALDFFRVAYDKIGLRNGKFITTDVFGNGEEFVTETGLWQSFNAKGELFDDGNFLCFGKKLLKAGKCSEILLAVTVNNKKNESIDIIKIWQFRST